MTDTLGDKIVRSARSLIGCPFRHAGCDRNGLDCVGLMVAVARDLGLADYRPPNYARSDGPRLLREGVSRFCDSVEGEPAAGDILLIKIAEDETHLAIATGEGTMVHARQLGRLDTRGQPEGKVVESAMHWSSGVELVGVYRWRA